MNKLTAAIIKTIGLPSPIVRREVCGKHLRFRRGTITETPDYDDAWTLALLRESRCFFDVGCNVGEMSLLALSVGVSRVVMMDANPVALRTATENQLLNNSTFVRSVLAFIGERDGEEVEFFTVGDGQAGSRFASHAKTASKKGISFKMSTLTLDTVAEEFNLAPDFVKMDIEGAEAEALNGAKNLTRKCQPRYIVEMHSQDELPMRQNGECVLAWCQEVNYTAHYLKTHSPVDSVEVFAHRGRCHLLLLPKNQAYPQFLRGISQGDRPALTP